MRPEILSTARPTGLRLAGFACVVVGAIAAGIGATRVWVAIGFVGDVRHTIDVEVVGTDVWEGKVVLLAAAAALIAMIAMRLARTPGGRRALAIALIALGATCVVLPTLVAVLATDRFGGGEGLDQIARALSAQLALPEDVLREQLTRQFERDLRVDVQPGLWLGVAGGLILVAGGALGLAWVRRDRSSRPRAD
jgi:hypothetical protein